MSLYIDTDVKLWQVGVVGDQMVDLLTTYRYTTNNHCW